MFELPLLLDSAVESNVEMNGESLSDLLHEYSIELITDGEHSIHWKLPKEGHDKRLPANREYVVLSVNNMKLLSNSELHLLKDLN